ncbi:GntR family transcriptional regulator [Microbacterium pygmaeum]|uniref:DNA-binding transcriptional regulator, GntR family n=1 Tax=Microbacterium pygmaeum TaxID=370764 RepID=A0A1G7URL7_9MICO|nr:GntR family transcriptional regulator [Microbacterium pygmaeum]SDG49390.1 DNA-binding transcriptional regulator, GntR family [Microbacterium pygmaeum]
MTTEFAPLAPRGTVLGDEVYTVLGEAILDGRLPPGERLRDRELAGRLGVSRTPVREALQRLERAGLVEVSPNRYTRVSDPDERLHHDTHEFVVHFMANAVRIATRRCSDEDLALAVQYADAILDASRADDHAGILAASARFFEHITHATRNVVFIRVMDEAELAFRRNLDGWQPFVGCPIDRTEGYTAFRDAVAARDGRLAESVIRDLHGID